jgi:transcriptional regulator with XRE-family HTH domain
MEQKPLRDWLKERGMKQMELAVATGMHLSSISGIVVGRIRPREHTKKAIARALGVSVEAVLWPVVSRPYPSTIDRYTGARRGPKPRKRTTGAPSKTLAPVA